MAVPTSTSQLATLNTALENQHEVVRILDQDGVQAYYLCRMIPAQKIADIVAFAASYGVTITP